MLPLALTVVVALGRDADAATKTTLQGAMSRAVDKGVVLQTVTLPSLRDDELRRAASGDVVAVVSVRWGTGHKKAYLRVYRVHDARFVERTIEFDAADAESERTRAVGLSFVSMLPEQVRAPEPERPENPPPVPTAATTAPPVPTAPPTVSRPPPTPTAIPTSTSTAPPRDRPPETFVRHASFDATGAATVGIGSGGYGGGFGGNLSARVYLTDWLAVRLGGGARVGSVDPAQATSTVFVGAAGLAVELPSSPGRRFGAGAHLSGLVIRQQLTHFSGDEPNADSQSTWQPGMMLGVEGLMFFGNQFALVLGSGVETAFGKNEVFARSQRVALIPPFRLYGNFGIRGYF